VKDDFFLVCHFRGEIIVFFLEHCCLKIGWGKTIWFSERIIYSFLFNIFTA
jgi:hypothetical protein